MTHEDLADTVPLYAIGSLEKPERQALEAHLLSGCTPCRTALKEFQSAAVALPFALNLTAPPRGLRAKIMGARVQESPEEAGSPSSATPSLEPGEWMKHLIPPTTASTTSFGWALSILIVGVLGLLIFFSWNTSARVTEDVNKLAELQSQVAVAKAKLATIQQQLSERDEALVQTREELQRRLDELAEVKDQLIYREAELDDLRTQLMERGGPLPQLP
ncbi:MAG: hypothetical protein MRJ66_09115 [Nitrospira sp.]|nr:hypothetical protein [Nitrospira sp.]